ncbi:hypothetical protein LZC95_37695 [Pendulispora brunnea]|uniref:Uncharacterized protein n=1 Tax=Pendulispora brunnea TaxID=2905690 RepID=A0ABZ2K0A8_9BACT
MLSVSIWSGESGELDFTGPILEERDGPDSWRPHRIDLVDTRERRLINPWKLGTRYFVTSRSTDEEQFHVLGSRLAEADHVALGTMLLGDDAVSVMLKPAGVTFELYPVLTLPKSAHSLPLGALRIATIHVAPIAMTKICAGDASAHAEAAAMRWADIAARK